MVAEKKKKKPKSQLLNRATHVQSLSDIIRLTIDIKCASIQHVRKKRFREILLKYQIIIEQKYGQKFYKTIYITCKSWGQQNRSSNPYKPI